MKAAVIINQGTENVLVCQEVECKPLAPKQVRIKVEAAGVNYIDALILDGQMPPSMMPPLPYIPGVECVGIVEEVGSEVTEFKKEDKVAYFGKIGASTFAESVICDASALAKIPTEVDSAKAAVIPVNYVTAYHMIYSVAKLQKGDTVLVHAAAGGVGTALIQLCKNLDVQVIGSVGSEVKKEFILSQGADLAINYKSEKIEPTIANFTKGKGVDISFNPVSGESMITDLALLRPFGQLVIFGFLAGLPEERLQDALVNQFSKSLSVSFSDIYTLYNSDFDAFKSILNTLYSMLQKKEIDPVIHQQFDLSYAKSAIDLLKEGRVIGKLILRMN